MPSREVRNEEKLGAEGEIRTRTLCGRHPLKMVCAATELPEDGATARRGDETRESG